MFKFRNILRPIINRRINTRLFTTFTLHNVAYRPVNMLKIKPSFHNMKAYYCTETEPSSDLKIINLINDSKLETATNLIDDLAAQSKPVSVAVYNLLLQSFSKQKAPDGQPDPYEENINKYLQQMRDCQVTPNTGTYFSVLTGLTKRNNFPRLSHYFEQMKSLGVQPDTVIYNIMMNSAAQQGDVNGLIKIYKDMGATKVKPDKYTFLAMIEGFGKEKDVENMLIAFQAYKGITRPDNTIYTTVLKILAQCKDKDQVIKILEEMKNRKLRPNSATYNALIEAAAMDGDMDSALAYYEEMKKNNFSPSMSTFYHLIEGFGNVNDVPRMMKHLDKLQMYSFAPDLRVFNCMIKCLGRTKSVKELLYIIKKMEMRRIAKDELVYATLVQAYLNNEMYDKVIATFESAKVEVVMKDIVFYKDVLRACAHLKNSDIASEVWTESLKNGISADVELLELLQRVYLASGKIKEAVQVFEEARRQSKEPTKEMIQLLMEVSSQQVDGDTSAALSKIKEQFS